MIKKLTSAMLVATAASVVGVTAVAAQATSGPPHGKIVFTRFSVTAFNVDIYAMSADGSGITRITSEPAGVFDREPAWAPNGKRIAFRRKASGNSDIWVMNADGSHQTRLTYGPERDTQPAWSPTGKRIAWTSNRS